MKIDNKIIEEMKRYGSAEEWTIMLHNVTIVISLIRTAMEEEALKKSNIIPLSHIPFSYEQVDDMVYDLLRIQTFLVHVLK